MKHEKISIKWKIFLYLLGFTAILLVVLWLIQICYLDSFYKMIKKTEVKQVTSEAIAILQSGSEDISEQIDALASYNNLAIFVTDTNGNALYSAEYIATTRLNQIPFKDFERYYEKALKEGGSTEIEFEGSKNMTFLPEFDDAPPEAMEDGRFMQNHGQEMMESVIYVNIVNDGTEDLVLFVNSQLTPIDATVHTLRVELVCITAIMIFLSMFIALLISRQISKSMIKINATAKEMAKGKFDVVFDGRDYKEIAELSDTLTQTAKELDKNESLKRELIANVSHDLRTPLTMIIAYSEMMRDIPGENTPENVQVVIDEAKRLTNLVNDMLDISKLQAGVLEKNASVYNLTESIKSVFERYNKLKEQDGYTINFECQKEVEVEADEFKIFQVIYNLVNNAINYAGEDKMVIVRQI
ncbi:MAG: sensor histidine kinase, partial [Roseburia sp.]